MTRSLLTIATAVRDQSVRTELADMIANMDGIAVATRSSGADILVFEVEPGREREFLDMRRALMEQVRGEVFLVCSQPNPKFLILAMRAGIHEVLPMPLTRQDLSRALARYRDRAAAQATSEAEAPGKGRIIGVLGARPGVGATTLAVNLAVELQRTAPTALMDMAVPLGEAPLFLDLEYTYTWGEVAQNLSRLDATYLRGVMPRHASGLSLLASPGDAPVPDVAAAMQPIRDQLRKSFAQTVLDTDGLLSPAGLKELKGADEIILVVNLALPCLAHAQRLADTLRSLESSGSRIRVAANRHHKHADILPAEAEEVLERKIDWLIPEDGEAALAAVNQGCTLAEAAAKSKATRAIRALAADVAKDLAIDLSRTQPAAQDRNAQAKTRSGLGALFSRRRKNDVNLNGVEVA